MCDLKPIVKFMVLTTEKFSSFYDYEFKLFSTLLCNSK